MELAVNTVDAVPLEEVQAEAEDREPPPVVTANVTVLLGNGTPNMFVTIAVIVVEYEELAGSIVVLDTTLQKEA